MVCRLLITGSRWWADWSIPYYALAAEWIATGGLAILVSGACPPRPDGTLGADRICEVTWESFGGAVEQHPARWDLYGKAAGFRRNGEMAALPDVYKCLAFKLNNSNGTANCIEQAQKHGIPVSSFEKWS
jgi:hypothetical protein